MQKLPKGYYAVESDKAALERGEFTYRGVTYAVTNGENCFQSLAEAAEKAIETPSEVLDTLDGFTLSTPVILFSKGTHVVDKFVFTRSLTLLGENAGISPNLSVEDPLTLPPLNPLRAEENESLLKGSYWYGKVQITATEATTVILDGFSSRGVSFRDVRTDGEGEVYVSMRNIVHLSPCGYMLYLFSNPKASGNLHREVDFRNIRVVDFDDYDYGTTFALVTAKTATFDGIVYSKTGQSFGFSDMPGNKDSGEANAERSSFTVKNSYFSDLSGIGGLSTAARSANPAPIDLTVQSCVFRDACRVGESPLNPALPNEGSSLKVEHSIFVDTRGASAAIAASGSEGQITVSDCRFEGFDEQIMFKPPVETYAPDEIENRDDDWLSETEDKHTVIGKQNADFTALDALYAGRKAYYGDQHVHTACGGTSDGSFPMSEWVAAMDEKQVDFAIVVDHRQMRGFFLPEWDEERFVYGTEPGTSIEGLTQVHYGQKSVHYNMLFPHKYSLAMVLLNFPEFEFRGDELTGSFRYPKFTKERFLELTAFVQSIGGIMVHPHPKTMLSSDDPLDYYLGEHTHQEVIYGSRGTAASFKNYELWVKLLKAGKHVYASSGSDTHGKVSNAALSTFYTEERSGSAFLAQMRTGDYTAGEIGIKMCIDGHPMGSELTYRDGMVLTLRAEDMFAPAWQPNTVYELRIVTDRGVAYRSRFNGKEKQAVSLKVENRAFYRAEIFDVTHGVWFAHGNPIWLDGEER